MNSTLIFKWLKDTRFAPGQDFVFGFGSLIAWPEALNMMAGSTVGGYLGGRLARRVNQKILRLIVIVFGFGLSMAYFVKTFA